MNPKNVVAGLFGTASHVVKLPITVGEQVLHRLHPGDKAGQPTNPVVKAAEKAESVAGAAAETVRAKATTATEATKDKAAAAKDKARDTAGAAEQAAEKSAKKAAKKAKKVSDKPAPATDEPQTVLLVDAPPTDLPPPVDVVGEALAAEAAQPKQPEVEPAALTAEDEVVYTSGS